MGEHIFRVPFWGESINITSTEESEAKIEIRDNDPLNPLIHLPRGYRIPVVFRNYSNPVYGEDKYYAFWEPYLFDKPRRLSFNDFPGNDPPGEVRLAKKPEDALVYRT